MFKEFKEFMLRRDLITVAVGFVVATVTFYLVAAIVNGLVVPMISALVGASSFENNVFTVSGSEFKYGAVIETAITAVFAVAAVYLLLVVPYRRYRRPNGLEAGTRACPECISPISRAAKRCPKCTAVVQPELA